MKTMSYSEIAERCEKNIRNLEHALKEIRQLDLLRRIRFGIEPDIAGNGLHMPTIQSVPDFQQLSPVIPK